MCNQQYLQLVAGEPVVVTGVVFNHRKNDGRQVIFNVSVVKDHRLMLYIEASRPGTDAVRIPHSYIISEVCPTGLSVKQQNLWKVLRHCFRTEIAFYQAQQGKARNEASRQEPHQALSTETKVVLPPKGDMVVLPQELAISAAHLPSHDEQSVAPKVEMSLVPGVPLFDPDWDEQELVSGPAVKPKGAVLTSEHLTIVNQAVGRFKLPTLEGPVWFTRTMSYGKDAYLLRLEDVPVRHCLYQHFAPEKQAGRKILVWIDYQGPMSTAVGSPAWHLVTYLTDTLCEEPGQKVIAIAA